MNYGEQLAPHYEVDKERYIELLNNRHQLRLNFINQNGREPDFIEMSRIMNNLNNTIDNLEYKIERRKPKKKVGSGRRK